MLDTRPKLSDRPELGDGEKLVLVGGETEEDQPARVVKRHALRFERAKVGDGIGEREGKLLRLRAAGGMHGSSVGDEEGTGEALLDKPCDECGHCWREFGPGLGHHATRRHGAERIEAEADVDRGGAKPLRLHVTGDDAGGLP